jgi:hypothetical protein
MKLSALNETLLPFAQYQDLLFHYGNLLEELNLQVQHVRLRNSDALFVINVSLALSFAPSFTNRRHSCSYSNICNLSSSVVLPITGLQLDGILLPLQFVSVQVHLEKHVYM